jgi:hypothetical protein
VRSCSSRVILRVLPVLNSTWSFLVVLLVLSRC